MADCQAALELADKAKRLTKTGKKESEELLKGMAKKTNALKDLLAKKDKWGSLAKAKALLVDAAKEMKKQRKKPKNSTNWLTRPTAKPPKSRLIFSSSCLGPSPCQKVVGSSCQKMTGPSCQKRVAFPCQKGKPAARF